MINGHVPSIFQSEDLKQWWVKRRLNPFRPPIFPALKSLRFAVAFFDQYRRFDSRDACSEAIHEPVEPLGKKKQGRIDRDSRRGRRRIKPLKVKKGKRKEPRGPFQPLGFETRFFDPKIIIENAGAERKAYHRDQKTTIFDHEPALEGIKRFSGGDQPRSIVVKIRSQPQRIHLQSRRTQGFKKLQKSPMFFGPGGHWKIGPPRKARSL